MLHKILFQALATLLLVKLAISGETDFSCSTAPSSSERADRRKSTDTLSIATYNAKWLFQNKNLGWEEDYDAMDVHFDEVADMVVKMDADILQLTEVEDCSALEELISRVSAKGDDSYKAYLVRGKDFNTKQNVALLTRIDPSTDMQRTDSRADYPVSGSQCAKKFHASGTSGVTKHFYTQIDVDGFSHPFFFVGLHFLSQPTRAQNCVKREAQAKVIEELLSEQSSDDYIVVMGDFNDFDAEYPGADGSKPTSLVLENIRASKNLTNAISELAQEERISYYSRRYKSQLDHVLLSPELSSAIIDVESFKDYMPYANDSSYDSDHFPIVVRLDSTKA